LTYQSSSFLKKGIKNTKQATKKNILPAIAQKLPMLEVIKHTDETTNKSQPIRFRKLLLILILG